MAASSITRQRGPVKKGKFVQTGGHPHPIPEVLRDADKEVLFRTLVQQHGKRLERFIVKHIGHGCEAEELAQQAFVEAARAFETFQGQSQLSTWLYGIAMNLVRNHLSRSPQQRYEFADVDALNDLVDESPSPDQALEQAQRVRHLNAAMADLPESMREVLLLVAVEELSYEEAAVLLCVPVGTVRSRLSRARAALRSKLQARGIELEFLA